MLLLHGVYKFGKKRVGFRNDWCAHCKAERIAEQHRTFNMWHVFFVPLIPLGFHSYWHCSTCGNDPRERQFASPTLLIIGGALMAFMGVMMLGSVFTAKSGERFMLLCVGLPMSLGAFGCWMLYKYQQSDREGAHKEVAPLTGETCPYCSARMTSHPEIQCSGCGVKRY